MKIFNLSILIIIIFIISLTSLSSFSNTQIMREDARNSLARLHIQFDEQSFYSAIDNNDIAIVDLFLVAGMSPNTIFSFIDKGVTPLIMASYNNNEEIIKILLEKGADINYMYPIKDNEKRTALYYSIENLYYENCKLLLEKGARTYFIHNNRTYKGKDLLDKMIAKKEYVSSMDGKPIRMDEQAIKRALKISGLLKEYSNNDLMTLTGKVLSGPTGWTFEPGDKVPKTVEYKLGAQLPDILKKILEQARNQNVNVTIIGEPDQGGFFYIDKIRIDEKFHTVPNYRGGK
jgi:hypothetical protein